eukprot:1457411-Rhodomonas_salina.1
MSGTDVLYGATPGHGPCAPHRAAEGGARRALRVRAGGMEKPKGTNRKQNHRTLLACVVIVARCCLCVDSGVGLRACVLGLSRRSKSA